MYSGHKNALSRKWVYMQMTCTLPVPQHKGVECGLLPRGTRVKGFEMRRFLILFGRGVGVGVGRWVDGGLGVNIGKWGGWRWKMGWGARDGFKENDVGDGKWR